MKNTDSGSLAVHTLRSCPNRRTHTFPLDSPPAGQRSYSSWLRVKDATNLNIARSSGPRAPDDVLAHQAEPGEPDYGACASGKSEGHIDPSGTKCCVFAGKREDFGGIKWSSLVGESFFPPATQFHASDIPDLSGNVVLVTGGNAGIGKETARVLLTKNARVYIACRDKAKGEAAIRELKTSTGKDAIFLQLNLANLESVKAAADEFLSKESQLNVLFNNAGVMNPPVEMVTDDGYDLQFGTNVVGHFYFTKLVMPALLAAAAISPDGTARVVNTSSNAHWWGGMDYNTLRDSSFRRKKNSWVLYGQSKAGNIIFSAELARRYGDRGIVSTALNPGGIKTELSRHSSSFTQLLVNILLHDVRYGALTQLYAGTTAEGAKLNGKYLIPWARIGSPRADTQDPQQGVELWNWLEEQVKEV